MALLTIKHMLCSLLLMFGCCGAPDEFQVGYGYGWQEDTTAPHFYRADDGYTFENGDTQSVHAAVTWYLSPRKVELLEPLVLPQKPDPLPVPAPVSSVQDTVKDGIKVFTAMDLASRILLLIAVLWLSWVYRKQLGRLIPRFGNGNGNGSSKK